MKTIYDLLLGAPDTQIIRCKLTYKAVAEGRFDDAAFFLRNAENEEQGEWAEYAGELAAYYENK